MASQQTHSPISVQSWPTGSDAGPALFQHWVNVLCLLAWYYSKSTMGLHTDITDTLLVKLGSKTNILTIRVLIVSVAVFTITERLQYNDKLIAECPSSGHNLTLCPAIFLLFYLNFQSLEVVSRYRDPQLRVAENYSYLFNLSTHI